MLSKNTEYSMQILLQENLPAIGALSQSFEMYAISSTGVMIELEALGGRAALGERRIEAILRV